MTARTNDDPTNGVISSTTYAVLDDDLNAHNHKLPTLPKSPIQSTVSMSRKRDRNDFLSSDGPLFSSDDLPSSSADNYLQPRSKRQYQRSWFESEDPAKLEEESFRYSSEPKLPRSHRPLTRGFDSGIWLGSDETNAEVSDLTDDNPKFVEQSTPSDLESGDMNGGIPFQELSIERQHDILLWKVMQHTHDPGDTEGPVFPYWQNQPEDLTSFHATQAIACERIANCVETGEEHLDLSSMQLQHVGPLTLRPLRYYTKQWELRNDEKNWWEEHYQQPLTPRLRLYLANNSLDEVPSEIYHLKDLLFFSLRGNNISEISPSISGLVRLNHVNLGGNQLKWLPWEINYLINQNLTGCILHPNPYTRPFPSLSPFPDSSFPKVPDFHHCASTQVAFLDITGSSIRGYPPAPTSMPEHWANSANHGGNARPPEEERSNIPSLMELSMRACYKDAELSRFPFLLPDDSPLHLRNLLQAAWKLREAGGKKCSVCNKDFVIPRTEWIEWWSESRNCFDPTSHLSSNMLPLLRRGCSWQCFTETPDHLFVRGWTTTDIPSAILDSEQSE